MKIFLFLISLYLWSGSVFSNEYYSYLSFSGKINSSDELKSTELTQRKVFLYEKDKTIFYNDFGEKFKSCENVSWICIYSNKLNFAIEKNWQPEKYKTWSKDNFEFSLSKVVQTSSGDKIFVINATNIFNSKRDPCVIFYSKSKGIVGFIFYYLKHDLSETYWLLGAKGFGNLL